MGSHATYREKIERMWKYRKFLSEGELCGFSIFVLAYHVFRHASSITLINLSHVSALWIGPGYENSRARVCLLGIDVRTSERGRVMYSEIFIVRSLLVCFTFKTCSWNFFLSCCVFSIVNSSEMYNFVCERCMVNKILSKNYIFYSYNTFL